MCPLKPLKMHLERAIAVVVVASNPIWLLFALNSLFVSDTAKQEVIVSNEEVPVEVSIVKPVIEMCRPVMESTGVAQSLIVQFVISDLDFRLLSCAKLPSSAVQPLAMMSEIFNGEFVIDKAFVQ